MAETRPSCEHVNTTARRTKDPPTDRLTTRYLIDGNKPGVMRIKRPNCVKGAEELPTQSQGDERR